MIDDLRLNKYKHFTISNQLFESKKQIHLLWTNAGLLLYSPTPADPSYFSPIIDSSLTSAQQIEERSKRTTIRNAATFGSFEAQELIAWDHGAKEMLIELLNDAKQFINAVNTAFKGNTRLSKDLKKQCLAADSRELTKQLRFITIGVLLKNVKNVPPIELYQHLVCRLPAEIICKGAAYRGDDEIFYRSLKPSELCSTQSILLNNNLEVSYISRVIEFNPKEDVWYQTGGSVLLTSGLRRDQDQNDCPKRNVPASLDFSLDDDEDSEDDI
jgi:hypothetical protein